MAFVQYFKITKNFSLKNLNYNINKGSFVNECKKTCVEKFLDESNQNETEIKKNFKDNEISNDRFYQNHEKKNETFFSYLSFFFEVKKEIKMIEWPTVDRLFRQFVIVLVSLVFSAIIIYSVDGLFALVSKFLFEGKF